MRSFFRLLKNDSATALSQQLPRRLMLGSNWLALQNRRHASLSAAVGSGMSIDLFSTQPPGLTALGGSRFDILHKPLARDLVAQAFFFRAHVSAVAHGGELHAGADVVQEK